MPFFVCTPMPPTRGKKVAPNGLAKKRGCARAHSQARLVSPRPAGKFAPWRCGNCRATRSWLVIGRHGATKQNKKAQGENQIRFGRHKQGDGERRLFVQAPTWTQNWPRVRQQNRWRATRRRSAQPHTHAHERKQKERQP
ncbi:hypothetical protein pqer_cds_213 [Pandoravirus quercus]|uniref:Uncharacterized protein n=2 Tax=Pandoravirus TaxID=2060084 RepID=A0A2U7U8B5_9VIRU|nr:hypothetical protein pqer_cds_213 [Pandoravirus quercus]AVK74635.1 hypothetical protein pqer_cds_213 [Pandoravirus quercus]QBZ80813.1 hypothetical protein pclt_cds_215 [Pandoravirus celtis]